MATQPVSQFTKLVDRYKRCDTSWHSTNGGKIALSQTIIDEIRQCSDLDLMELITGNAFKRMSQDVGLFIDCLYVIHKSQCDQRRMTSEQFGRSIHPRDLDAAGNAFCYSLSMLWERSLL